MWYNYDVFFTLIWKLKLNFLDDIKIWIIAMIFIFLCHSTEYFHRERQLKISRSERVAHVNSLIEKKCKDSHYKSLRTQMDILGVDTSNLPPWKASFDNFYNCLVWKQECYDVVHWIQTQNYHNTIWYEEWTGEQKCEKKKTQSNYYTWCSQRWKRNMSYHFCMFHTLWTQVFHVKDLCS